MLLLYQGDENNRRLTYADNTLRNRRNFVCLFLFFLFSYCAVHVTVGRLRFLCSSGILTGFLQSSWRLEATASFATTRPLIWQLHVHLLRKAGTVLEAEIIDEKRLSDVACTEQLSGQGHINMLGGGS